MVGELIEADHILFQVTPGVNLDMLRAHAKVVLDELMADPSRFAEVAREQSNCPSAAVGGSLGQLGRGDTVPEFERAVFALPAGCCRSCWKPATAAHRARHAPHRRRMLAYEQVAQQIAHALSSVSRDTAWRQYLAAGGARQRRGHRPGRRRARARVRRRERAMKPPSVRESVSESAAASVSASAVAPGARSSPASARAGGLIDGHGRRIDYLRVSVTDRCDLRCTYCLPRTTRAPRFRPTGSATRKWRGWCACSSTTACARCA